MRSFDYTEKWKKLLTPEIVGYLRGKEGSKAG